MADNLNMLVLQGNLGRDPETRATRSGSIVCTFSLCCTTKTWKQDQPDKILWMRCTAFGKKAETISKYLHKGDEIIAYGKLIENKWETREGEEKSSMEMWVSEFHFTRHSRVETDAARSDAVRDEAQDEDHDPNNDDGIPF